MSQSLRLAQGGEIDRAAPVRFSFGDRVYEGFAGDTLASALLANDVKLIARSFKYHRPRGVLTAGPEEPSALVTLHAGAHAEPNARATIVRVREGLVASPQNAWPSLEFDALAVNGLLSPVFAAGFYYKAFMWPSAFWERVYEPIIRRAAGLGKLSGRPDPDVYDRQHAFCDLLVIGAGPAGLMAALAAARAGLRVILAEEDVAVGGRLRSERRAIDGASGLDWAEAAAAELETLPSARVLTNTSVFGAYDGGVFGAIETLHDGGPGLLGPRQRYWKIAARRTILAAGALERPLVFAGNDLPGVMLASAGQTYAQRYAVAPGRSVAIACASDSGWKAADDLAAAGVDIVARIDLRAGQTLVRAHGGQRVRAVTVRAGEGERTIECDALLMAGGWAPNVALAQHLGGRPDWSEAHAAFLAKPPPGMRVVGAAAGRYALADALSDGAAAARAIAEDLGFNVAAAPIPRADEEGVTASPPTGAPVKPSKAFVDFQNDVTAADVALAVQEGYRSVEHLKRYTTLGMATDQGRTSNLNGHALLAAASDRPQADVGAILSRPPYAPVAIGALAGMHRGEEFRPVRRTPSHALAEEMGAAFVDAGMWKRAQFFPRPGESGWLETVTREVRTVRGGVGICDVSTLGKIDVQGADAGALLDRLYVNAFSTLAVGKARYGLMLREDGFVFDDGTTTRFAEDHFVVTTTTANAARVMQHIDFFRQAVWPELDAQAVSVTDQWAQYAVAGPQSRALLAALLPDEDLSNEALPYMGARETAWRGLPTRLFRLSFSGELAYEVAVPAAFGEALARALLTAGAPFGAILYGTEALGVMRIEKGHPAGPELNGQTTAHDIGLGKLLSKKKPFVGSALARRVALTDPARPTLVGLKPLDPQARLGGGAHLLAPDAPRLAAHDQGWISSVAFSPTLDSWIALGFVKNGAARLGERLVACDPVRERETPVEIVSPVFVDPEGERLRG